MINGINRRPSVLHPVLPVLFEIQWSTIIQSISQGMIRAINQRITQSIQITSFQLAFIVEYIFTIGNQDSHEYFSQSFLLII